ncbi:hypothetical protein Q5762_09445 [Streptomyces sp. P9(2023)]|uniref:hypothetical protein n=1 Tax=Streptomyces sp. P9(2023) TaxID=3064394 RepID=UPI0028F454D3|nr:hypothetical protein [Streptomyces sp. P9(2023)]MDT9688572.1 hypothetical protein [Streptomyces sp. P9(2023)]
MALRTGWLSPTGQTRLDTRHTDIGATTPSGPLTARSGILPGTDDGKYRVGGLWMSGNGPMTATLFAGRAVIQGPAAQGPYHVTLDADTVLTFADGSPLHPRIDLVVLRVRDDQFDGSQKSEATVEIVQGEAKAVPEPPGAPALSLTLFTVKVPAAASAGTGGIPWTTAGTVTDLRVTTAGVGGILPVYNNAAVPGSYPGQYQDNDNAHLLQRWDGTSWVAYPKEIGGIAPSGTLSTGGYVGQYRDSGGQLQRWNGSSWVAYPPVVLESANSGVAPLANWTVVAFDARRTRGIATVSVTCTRTSQVDAGSAGNTPDDPMCILPAGWRPAITVEAPASDGFGDGGAYISTSGQVTLRTWSSNGALVPARNVRVSATYILQ